MHVYYISFLYLDIDECTTVNGGCEQICENTVGARICRCHVGYLVNSTDSDKCDGKRHH